MTHPNPSRRPGGAHLLFVAAAAVIVCAGLKSAQDIVVQFLLAVFLALISLPAMHAFARLGVPAPLRVVGVMLGLIAILLGTGVVVGSEVRAFEDSLPAYQDRLEEIHLAAYEWATDMGLEVESWRPDDDPEPPPDPAALPAGPPSADGATLPSDAGPTEVSGGGEFDLFDYLDYARTVLATLGSLASSSLVILLLLVFLLAESGTFHAKVRRATHGRGQVQERLDEVAQRIHRYFAIKTAVSALTGVTAGGVLAILGVDFPILWGLAAFGLNFVPNIGSFLAAVPPVLIALVQPDGSWQIAVGVVALYVAINMVYGNVLEPKWLGKGLDLSTFVVFASLVFWGWLLGPVGMLLSTPLTAALRIAMEAFDDTRPIAVLLGAGVPDGSEASDVPAAGA